MKDLYNFEKNLKKKLEEHEFPFDELNWEKASQMIDASRQNRRPLFYFSLSAIALLFTTGLVYFVLNSQSDPIRKHEVESNTLLAVNEAAITILEHKTSNSLNESLPNTDNLNSSSETKSTIITKNSNVLNQKKQITQIKTAVKAISINSSSVVSHVKTDSKNIGNKLTETKELSTSQKAGSNNSNVPNSTPNQIKSTSEKTEKPKSSTVKEIPVILGSNLNSNVSNHLETDMASNSNGNTNKLGEVIHHSGSHTNEAMINSKLTDSSTAFLTIPASTLISTSVDSLLAQSGSENLIPPFKLKTVKNLVYAEAGASYLVGWATNSTLEANGFNPIAGLNYVHFLPKKITVLIGAQYNSINHLSQSSYSVSNSNYDFGVKREVTSIQYIKLHYLTIPAKIGINFNKNNFISVGANMAILLNSESRTNKYRTNNNESISENNQLSTKKETGYTKGFKAYDIQASVSYRRIIVKAFSVQAELFYGITDIKNNEHFRNDNFERSMGGKLTLCYDLFKN